MKIAVLCLPGIGDSLMATPMIKLLRMQYPKAQIDLICMFDGVAHLFKNNKNINTVYRLSLYNEPLMQGIWEILLLRRNHYDISILAFPAFRREYHIVHFLLGAKKRISHMFTKGFWTEYNFLDTDRITVDESVHNCINNLNLLSVLKIHWRRKLKGLHYDLSLFKNEIVFGKRFLKNLNVTSDNTIGIHPGSINSAAGIYKRWSVKNFALLTKELIRRKKCVLIFVGPYEREIGEKILEQVGKTKYCHLITNTEFGQSLGILSQIRLLISNDNGFAHLANALKIKGIVLFGPTNPLWCSPVDTRYAISVRNAKFTPWFRNDTKVTHPPKGIQSGMNAISVQDVISRIEDIL